MKPVMAFVVEKLDQCICLLRVPLVEIDGFVYSDLLVIALEREPNKIFMDLSTEKRFNRKERRLQEVEALLDNLGIDRLNL
jgi:hypothetical protein